MIKKTNSSAWNVVNEQLQAMEQEKAIVNEMTRMVKYILSKSADDGLRWHGSRYDLLEMLKVVYDKGSIVHNDGTTAGFKYLAKRVFAIFNETMVCNPYSKAQRALKRKGIRSNSMVERMKLVMACGEKGRIEVFWNSLIVKAI